MPSSFPSSSSSSWGWFRPSSLPRASTASLQMALVLAFLAAGYVQAVAECMSGNRVKCFDCNSHEDPRCSDPFNWTVPPLTKDCEGCCVKMVQGIGTEDEKIRRSCTDDIDINLFMVDHVCMSEGGGKGKMCFCEANECNGAEEGAIGRQLTARLLAPVLLVLALGRRQLAQLLQPG